MTTLDAFDQDLGQRLAALEAQGLRRALRLPHGIDLVSNDYLGLADHPHLIERMTEALSSVGAGAKASRLLRGHLPIFDETEARLAAFSGTPAALLFGSGWAANLGLLTSLLEAGDLVFSDERNHASIIDGLRLAGVRKVVYGHNDVDGLARMLHGPRPRRTFIVTESVFSMDGDLAPLKELCDLADAHRSLVIVDEAHATGLYGPRGSGRVEDLGLRERVLLSMHTGGKALGVGGAWVAGSSTLRDLLVNRARSFIFSTAPLPIMAVGLGAALDVLEREPQRRHEVHRKAGLLRDALRAAGVEVGASASPIVPLIVGENERALGLAAALQEDGFDTRAIRPPTVPKGTARLRVTVRYPVSDEDLGRFVERVREQIGKPGQV